MKKNPSCKPLLAGILLAAASSCFRQDVRNLEISVPAMGSPECARRVQEVFTRIDGIRAVQLDLPNRRIVVTYDGRKLGIKNIEYLLTAAGFEANGNPPDPQARAMLPPECR